MPTALEELQAVLSGTLLPESQVRPDYEAPALQAVSRALSNTRNQVFPSGSPTATLRLERVRKALRLPKPVALTFLVPVVVEYSGSASGEEWAVADKALEALVTSSVEGAMAQFIQSPKVKLLKRRKSKPFEDSPLSLTTLKYRVEKP